MAVISKNLQFKLSMAPPLSRPRKASDFQFKLSEAPPLSAPRGATRFPIRHDAPRIIHQKRPEKGVNLVTRAVKLVERLPHAHRVFWALKEDWWKQLFDGDVHLWGPEVFDKGLHGGSVEPGFYKSALDACQFASQPDLIMKAPTVPFYFALHSIACKHFDGKSTLMTASKAGRFTSPIDKGIHFGGNVFELFRADRQMYTKLKRECNIYSQYHELGLQIINEKDVNKRREILERNNLSNEEAYGYYRQAVEWNAHFQNQVKARIAEINAFILELSTQFGLNHPMSIITLDLNNSARICIRYLCTKEEVDRIVPLVFDEYNKGMAGTTSNEKKLKFIALLFQTLEWMHPFNDGQGRTDLILLAKELCRHGFNPAILEFPYVSTFSLLLDWLDYLKDGMSKWRQAEVKKNEPLRPFSPAPSAGKMDVDEKEKQAASG